jgi:nucleoid-associated protein YgaU
MTTSQSCPICGLENISADQVRCPQCDADLACFKVLDAIPEESPPVKAEPPPIITRKIAIAAALLILLILGFLVFQFYRFKTLEAQNAELLAESKKLREQSSKLEAETLKLTAQYEKLSHQNVTTESLNGKTEEQPSEIALAKPEQNLSPKVEEAETQADNVQDKPAVDDSGITPGIKEAESQAEENQLQQEPAVATSEQRLRPKIEKTGKQAEAGKIFSDQLQEKSDIEKSEQPPVSQKAEAAEKQSETAKRSPDRSGFWSYEATEKDTLWDVAEKFYGAGYYYPVLLEHNPHIGIYSVGKGSRLKILHNIDQVKSIYRRITVKEGYEIYWNYTIVEGDTLQSVAERFYKAEDVKKQLSVSDSEAELQPGKKIRILLK